MSSDKLEESFLLELFNSCILNKNVCDIVLKEIKANYLPEQEHKDLLQEIRNQVRNFKKQPTFGSLRLFFRKDHDVLDLLSNIQDIEEKPDEEQILMNLQDFIKESMFSELLVESSTIYNKGDKKKAYNLFVKGAEEFSRFSLSASYSEAVFTDFDKRQANRVLDNATGYKVKIPTGIDELDRALSGGPELGELIMWMARSKGGKSLCLTHLGVVAARNGFSVLHFQAEGTKRQCFNRYDSNWTGTTYYDIKDANVADAKLDKLRNIVRTLGKNDIHVIAPEKFGALTMVDIRQKLIEMKKIHDIKLVIIDYMDLCSTGTEKYNPSEDRLRLQKVNRMMKDLAMEQNVLIHTATQASDVDMDKVLKENPNFVLTRSHLSEYKGKVEAVDALFTINASDEEKKNKSCRIWMEAVREHEGGQLISIKQNLKLSRFYDRKATLKEYLDL
jgi:replicative DNA helicase